MSDAVGQAVSPHSRHLPCILRDGQVGQQTVPLWATPYRVPYQQRGFFVSPTSKVTSDILTKVHAELARDDVWNPGFLQHGIFTSVTRHSIYLTETAHQVISSWGSQIITVDKQAFLELPSGPYLCNAGRLHEVSRLYLDTPEGFMTATIQSSYDQFLYDTLNVSVFADEYSAAIRQSFDPHDSPELPLVDSIALENRSIDFVIGTENWAASTLPNATPTPAFASGRPLFEHAPSVKTMRR
ncbi:hypothetical protein UA08_06264 [Talaromyces atroroseus]|uniref:Scytalone dehydratase-like protein Arp1 N-terminal domain-containing protein n=1 Tax=Talaromyces atroroseus TaxID=1441469 RepID=A0A225ABM3_TALAT|nr:hypothetical protein UA08_06264 [Talaromyces atroroseus]OKL58392.1 hypothetical protein UA08_06264 [Talaromyces atroroseus]